MKILALGDIVGGEGRRAVEKRLPSLRKELELDFVIANGENSAGGIGITRNTLTSLLQAGIDCVTGGNHSWKHREVYSTFDTETRVLRPANYPDPAPGRGEYIYTLKDGRKIAILNLQGTTFMEALPCPFTYAMNWTQHIDNTENVKIRIVDFHAEASSEKKALGFALDGKVSAVFGTHTHVQTADPQILPEGTAYLTDLGMCGIELSCIGMCPESVIARFLHKRPVTFKRAKGDSALNGFIMEIDDDTGLAKNVSLLRENAPRTKR